MPEINTKVIKLYAKLKGLIESDYYPIGGTLPPVRQVAFDEHLSVVTVRHVYRILEKELSIQKILNQWYVVSKAQPRVRPATPIKSMQTTLLSFTRKQTDLSISTDNKLVISKLNLSNKRCHFVEFTDTLDDTVIALHHLWTVPIVPILTAQNETLLIAWLRRKPKLSYASTLSAGKLKADHAIRFALPVHEIMISHTSTATSRGIPLVYIQSVFSRHAFQVSFSNLDQSTKYILCLEARDDLEEASQ